MDAKQRLIRVNTEAHHHGVAVGQLMSGAQALCPQLHCLPRQTQTEASALNTLASWALQFSPRVSLASADEIVLEVGASLRLFGGLEAFQIRLCRGCADLPYNLRAGFAPTPLGAQILARCHDPNPALSTKALQQRLNSAPLEAMSWPAKINAYLHAVGMQTLGDCEALPRDGFIKRYGAQARQQLDQAWGYAPDPRENFKPPMVFNRGLDLLTETAQLDQLKPGFKSLFYELQAQLQGLGMGLLSLRVKFAHANDETSQLNLQLQRPSRDAKHWMLLLEHRLERLKLQAPVREIRVHADHFVALGHKQSNLWSQGNEAEHRQLLEQLGARLGSGRLYSIKTQASHCPENAWRKATADDGGDAFKDMRQRPIWLLHTPQVIPAQRLMAFNGPERLETQWWDQPCQRDYYRARTDQGQEVWVYREHGQPERWYLHGLFA